MNRSALMAIAAATVAGGVYYGQGTPVNLQPSTPGTQQVGNANISGKLIAGSVQAADSSPTAQVIVGNATSSTGANFGGFFRSDSVLGRALYGRASAPSGTTHGVYGQSDSPGGRGVTGVAAAAAGNATGVWGQTGSGTGRGVYGYTTNTSGVNYGVYGQTSSPNGFGVYSQGNMHATGIVTASGMALSGSSFVEPLLKVTNATSFYGNGLQIIQNVGIGINVQTTNGKGIQATAQTGGDFLGIGTAGYGVIGFANSASGNTVGVLGESISTSGIGVLARNSIGTGETYALQAISESTAGYAGHFDGKGIDSVFIRNSGTGRGLRASTTSDSAIWGTTTSGFAGVDGRTGLSGGYGVYGLNEASTGTPIGVAGQAGAGGFGVYSFGVLGASGSKAFRIDHPLDPENRYLMHYSTESPTPQNFYSGNVKTNAQGKAWVELPNYFAEINTNFKYQLTVVDDNESDSFVQVKIGRKIAGNRFLIMSSEPNVEVSWLVEADRNDLWIRKYGAPTEVDKQPSEKGLYQHPELYGLGKEHGINETKMTGAKGRPKRPAPHVPASKN